MSVTLSFVNNSSYQWNIRRRPTSLPTLTCSSRTSPRVKSGRGLASLVLTEVRYREIFPRSTSNSEFEGVLQTEFEDFSVNGESSLDFQYGMSLIGPKQNVTLYQVGDLEEG